MINEHPTPQRRPPYNAPPVRSKTCRPAITPIPYFESAIRNPKSAIDGSEPEAPARDKPPSRNDESRPAGCPIPFRTPAGRANGLGDGSPYVGKSAICPGAPEKSAIDKSEPEAPARDKPLRRNHVSRSARSPARPFLPAANCPGGTYENSHAIHCVDTADKYSPSPGGTTERQRSERTEGIEREGSRVEKRWTRNQRDRGWSAAKAQFATERQGPGQIETPSRQ